MTLLPGSRLHCVIPYSMLVSVAVRPFANCYTPFTYYFIYSMEVYVP